MISPFEVCVISFHVTLDNELVILKSLVRRMGRKTVPRVKGNNPGLVTRKIVSLDFEKEWAHEGRQGNVNASKQVTFKYQLLGQRRYSVNHHSDIQIRLIDQLERGRGNERNQNYLDTSLVLIDTVHLKCCNGIYKSSGYIQMVKVLWGRSPHSMIHTQKLELFKSTNCEFICFPI